MLTVLSPANTTGYFTAEPWGIVHVLLGICSFQIYQEHT